MKNGFTKLASVYLVALVGACVVLACAGTDDLDSADEGSGTVEFNWTIDGMTDPSRCEKVGAVALETVLTDEEFSIEEFEFPCEDFSAVVTLGVGDYSVRTTLIDADDFPVTDEVVSSQFVLAENQRQIVEVDFPAESFDGGGVGSRDGGI